MDKEDDFSGEGNGWFGEDEAKSLDNKTCPSNDETQSLNISGLDIKVKPSCNSSDNSSDLLKGHVNGDRSLDINYANGMWLWLMSLVQMLKATNMIITTK